MLIFCIWLKKPYAGPAPMVCEDLRVRGMAALFQLGNNLARHEQIAKRELTVGDVQAASHVRPWSPKSVHHWDAANRATEFLPSHDTANVGLELDSIAGDILRIIHPENPSIYVVARSGASDNPGCKLTKGC